MINATTLTIGDAFVESDLVVFASQKVKIYGKITVPEGRSVAFFTPVFHIYPGGGISESGTAPDYPWTDIVSSCRVLMTNGSFWTFASEKNLDITANYKPAKGTCLTELDGTANLTMPTGENATKKSPNGTGDFGGTFRIGGIGAARLADSIAKKHGHPELHAFSQERFIMDTPLRAGSGGNGLDDPNGKLSGSVYVFKGGWGGHGGDVLIDVGSMTSALRGQFALRSGNGGNAGAIGGAINCAGTPMNGTATSPNAISTEVDMGHGGVAGSIFIQGRHPADILAAAGDGGLPSLLTNAQSKYTFCAGNGFASPLPGTTTYGTGGSLTVKLQTGGQPGTGSIHDGFPPTYGQFYPMVFTGGSACAACGGAETLPGVAQGQLIAGLNGGDLTFVLPPFETPADLLKTYGLQIQLANYGMGGGSILTDTPYSYCPSPDPPGINGGGGGTLHDNGLWPVLFPTGSTSWGYAMYGGAGSAGNPGGSTGPNGFDDEGLQIGQAGPVQNIICNGRT
ncbi:MAG: hypothetical protein JO192_12730 [Candidatus Eremiobacteraeota bacterium]|nr:hypothetical protein [Candidatus Eremiobacteraeota bacterium]MBV8721742.1 hypothetical protein [Candidatus Eremiobacteraeota bacterium]